MTMTFGSELLRLLKLKQISQQEVAKGLKVDRAYMSRVVNEVTGHVPTEDRIAHIAILLKLSERERDGLFFAAGKMPPEVIQAMRRDPSLFSLVRNATNRRRKK